MSEISQKEGDVLRKFANTYFTLALEVANGNNSGKPCSHDEFYRGLYTKLFDETELDEIAILYFHHSFHWTFFNDGLQSPLGYNSYLFREICTQIPIYNKHSEHTA